ncbi:MAG TPA: 50S ribosomal protein L18 [Candidatus Saccharimonadales bacterium]|nr:50S ribosomal protein L18 [Candidatus Saccharimonadales bacterium]
MDRLAKKNQNRHRRAGRVRSVVKGTPERPRLSVHISNLHVTSQIIDDSSGKTLAYATTVGQKLNGNKSELAANVGKDIAVKAKKAKVKKVAFDRGGRKYHGRIKALADSARESGLEF